MRARQTKTMTLPLVRGPRYSVSVKVAALKTACELMEGIALEPSSLLVAAAPAPHVFDQIAARHPELCREPAGLSNLQVRCLRQHSSPGQSPGQPETSQWDSDSDCEEISQSATARSLGGMPPPASLFGDHDDDTMSLGGAFALATEPELSEVVVRAGDHLAAAEPSSASTSAAADDMQPQGGDTPSVSALSAGAGMIPAVVR